MVGNQQLNGKIALITAAGAGIGRSIALEWGKRGGSVMVTDVQGDAAKAVTAELVAAGVTAFAGQLDVRQPEQIKTTVAKTIAQFGAIDALFNVAGVNAPKTIEETEDEEWLSLIEINLTSVYRCSRAVIAQMRKQGGGAIVNVASVAGIVGEKRCAAYSASKGGVVLLTRNMAMDFAKDGIRVNALCPAGTLSPRIQEYMRGHEDLEIESRAMRPLNRFASPDEIAQPAVFLATDEASYITGTSLVVDGGLLAGFRVPVFDRM